MKLIDLDALNIGMVNPAKCGNRGVADGWNSLFTILQQAAVVDAELVRHGAWEKSDIPHEKYCCSVCGCACWYYDFAGDVARSRFCPTCGAKMDGDSDV